MRLFVAVEIDAAVARVIDECSAALKRDALSHAPRARITWVPSERLHLTIRFIGEVDDDRVDTIADALKPALTTKAFDLACEGAGAFPASGHPRVLWIGIAGGVESLAALEREVSGRLTSCGIPRETRQYRPHLTLARVRDATGLRSGPLMEGCATRRFGTSHVDAITLFQSRLSPQGPTYVAIQRTRLQSA